MSSSVSICNQALGWLGQSPITSFDDPGAAAQLCKQNYAEIRDAVLEEGSWSFASRRISLSPSATAPIFGYTYKFELPKDVLTVKTVSDNPDTVGLGDDDFQWDLEERYIMCNSPIIYAKAVVQITDTSKFSPMFTQVLATRLAADFAVPLTQNEKLQTKYLQLYQVRMLDAVGADSIQGRNRRFRQRRYHKVR